MRPALRRDFVNMLKNEKTGLSRLVALLAMFLVATATAGAVWHNHATGATETNCAICHLEHQPFQQPAVVQSTAVLVAASPGPVVDEALFVPGPVLSHAATRAPPRL